MDSLFVHLVGRTGFEPVTSALSRQRSKPAELTTRMGGKYTPSAGFGK